MRNFLFLVLCVVHVLMCAAESISEETLERLSASGRRCVEEEVKRALLGLKEVKETMERREEEHRLLMEALTHSNDKKKGVKSLLADSRLRLSQVRGQCEVTRSWFSECRPCLEEVCKNFYTSSCRRGVTSFTLQVEEFFRKTAAQLEATDQVYGLNQDQDQDLDQDQDQDQDLNQDQEQDQALVQAEAAFSRLLSDSRLLLNRSSALVKSLQLDLVSALDLRPGPPLAEALQGDSGGGGGGVDSSFFRTLGLDHVLDSVSDFGRNGLHRFRSTVKDELEENLQHPDTDSGSLGQTPSSSVCRRLRRAASECWRLRSLCQTCEDQLITECPGVQQLVSEVEEMLMLLNASEQQLTERLQLIHRHTDDTQRWLRAKKLQYGWVGRSEVGGSEVGGSEVGRETDGKLHSSFRVISVQSSRDSSLVLVLVSVLDSDPISVSVPSDLDLEDPAFIRYVTLEAVHTLQVKG